MELNITPNPERSQEQNFRFCAPKKLFFLTEEQKITADVTARTYVRYGLRGQEVPACTYVRYGAATGM